MAIGRKVGPSVCRNAVLLLALALTACESADIQDAYEKSKKVAQNAFAQSSEVIGVAWASIKETAGNIDAETLKEQLGAAYDSFASALSGLLDQTGYAFSDLFGNPADEEEAYKELAVIKGCEHVVEIIQRASEATKITANYLLALARQESGCRSDARAKGSTAVGMFQFIEVTWIRAMHDHGADYGEDDELIGAIVAERGRLSIRPASKRDVILDRRLDAQLSAYLAAEFARENADYLQRKRSKPLTATDLYMAHFLGAGGASEFLAALDNRPHMPANLLLPAAAAANPSVFYFKGDRTRPRSVSDVYAFFKTKMESA